MGFKIKYSYTQLDHVHHQIRSRIVTHLCYNQVCRNDVDGVGGVGWGGVGGGGGVEESALADRWAPASYEIGFEQWENIKRKSHKWEACDI